jgi:hypothetical protein
LNAVLNGKTTKEQIEHLRKALLLFIEPIVGLDAAVAQLVAGPLKDHPILFRDSEQKLAVVDTCGGLPFRKK